MSKAVFIHGAHDVRVGPYTPPPPRNDSVMLKVAAVGLCGSDLHYYKDGGIGGAVITKPFVPGHEFAGYLVNDEAKLGLARGTLVAVDPNRACGACEYCLAGHANLCPKVEFIGAPPFDGAMTETIAVPSELVVPIPQSFTPLQGVMLEPFGRSHPCRRSCQAAARRERGLDRLRPDRAIDPRSAEGGGCG